MGKYRSIEGRGTSLSLSVTFVFSYIREGGKKVIDGDSIRVSCVCQVKEKKHKRRQT